MEWSFTIKARDHRDLVDLLTVAAQYARMFPTTFDHALVDTNVPIVDGLEASRIE